MVSKQININNLSIIINNKLFLAFEDVVFSYIFTYIIIFY